MSLSRFLARPLLALAASALFLSSVRAQAPVILGPATYSTRGAVQYGALANYGIMPAYSGYYSQTYAYIPDSAVVSYYAAARSPVVLTTINYPGIYGALTYGVTPYTYTYRASPTFGTFPPAVGNAQVDVATLAMQPGLVSLRPGTDVAHVNVRLPADAELRFQGVTMTQAGGYRDFVTPPLPAGQTFNYDVQATWREDGQKVVRNRKVQVRAGDRVEIDFYSPTPDERGASPELRTRDVPRRPGPAPEMIQQGR